MTDYMEPTIGSSMNLLSGNEAVITWIAPTGDRFALTGGMAPVLGAQEGVTGSNWKGLQADGKHVTEQGARQDGETWKDFVYEALEIDFVASIYGFTSQSFRDIQRAWFDGWRPKQLGRMVYFTPNIGEWWLWCRLGKANVDELKFAPANVRAQDYNWVARADFPLWQSFPSTSNWNPIAASDSGFLAVTNRGNVESWPTYLAQGPFTLLTLGDGLSGATVTFGPLAAGQVVKIQTQPSLRSIVEITTNDNLYSLLTGRFNTPIDANGTTPTLAHIPVSITGAVPGQTAVMASLTPYRDYPE